MKYLKLRQQPYLVGKHQRLVPSYAALCLSVVLRWETDWELQLLLAWVRNLMLLRGQWTLSIQAPFLVFIKPTCPSLVDHL